jgi:predicted aspartyl protease
VTDYAIIPVTIEGLTGYEVSTAARDEKAMIDTGATSSAVHPSLADDLGLRSLGSERSDDSREPAPLYRVRITIGVIGVAWDLYVIGREYDTPQLHRVIIGTDILKDCGLTFNGPDRGRFCLAYQGQG